MGEVVARRPTPQQARMTLIDVGVVWLVALFAYWVWRRRR